MSSSDMSIQRFLESLTTDKLKQLLQHEGLPKSGLKVDIIQRIIQNISPQRILLHIHDDDVIAFAEKCNYIDHSTAFSSPKKSRRLNQGEIFVGSLRSHHIRNSDDLEEYRRLADRCRDWILRNVWNDEPKIVSVSINRELIDSKMEDVGPIPQDLPVFSVEEVVDSSYQPETTVALTRPLVTFPFEDNENEDDNESHGAISKIPSSLKFQFEGIKQIILTTLFARLKSIHQLLLLHLDHSPEVVPSDDSRLVTFNATASELVLIACNVDKDVSAVSCSEGVSMNNERRSALISAIQDLCCLFWKTIQSSISLHQLNRKTNDTGAISVCTRLVEMTQLLDFEPNLERAEIREDEKGAIQVGCQGIYYYNGEPIGPFRLYLALIHNTTSSESASSLENGPYWCVRALVWECL